MKFNKSNCCASLSDENLDNQLRCATTKMEMDLWKLSKSQEKQVPINNYD